MRVRRYLLAVSGFLVTQLGVALLIPAAPSLVLAAFGIPALWAGGYLIGILATS